MGLGKQVRLNRLFAHPTGRLLSVAFDHFIGYNTGMSVGFSAVAATLQKLAQGMPDAITLHKGLAATAWQPYAGRIPLILQSILCRADDTAFAQIVTPLEAVRLGADAIAAAAFLRGDTEAAHLHTLAAIVEQAAFYDLPVVAHVYPRVFGEKGVSISTRPEDIAWVVRCAVEVGVDIVKAPYCGDIAAFRQIVSNCPVPLVAAGGPQVGNLEDALREVAGAVAAGSKGAVVGRNIWGHCDIQGALAAYQAVVHDNVPPEQAAALA